jgi:hypothetical protein
MGYKKLPPLIRQRTDYTCWAATMSAWLAVTPGRVKLTQDELIQNYSTLTDENGALPPQNYREMAYDQAMTVDFLPKGEVTEEYIEKMIADKGHLILIFNSPDKANGSHAVIVYGIGYPTGGSKQLAIMDPWRGIGYRNRPLWYFLMNNIEVGIGYRED